MGKAKAPQSTKIEPQGEHDKATEEPFQVSRVCFPGKRVVASPLSYRGADFGAVHTDFVDGESMAWRYFLESKGKSGLTLLASNGGRSLHLENRSIDDAGAVLLANALVGTPVQKLYLTNNTIGDRGATAIAQVLLQCSVRTIC